MAQIKRFAPGPQCIARGDRTSYSRGTARPHRRKDRIRALLGPGLLGPGLLGLTFVLTIAGAVLPWWTTSTTYYSPPPQINGVSTFLPGYMRITGNGPNVGWVCTFTGLTSIPGNLCPTLGTTSTLYLTATAFVLAAVALLAVPTTLLVAARLIRLPRTQEPLLTPALVIVAAAILLSGCLMVSVGQASTFNNDTTSGYGRGFFEVDWTCWSSPLSSFAGTCNASHISFWWGPGAGWFSTLAAGLTGLAAAAMLYRLRPRRVQNMPKVVGRRY